MAAGCGGGGAGPEDADPALVLGYVHASSYAALDDDHTAWVINAPQGGYWSMPDVRTQGLARQATVDCTLTDDAQGPLGDQTTTRTFDEQGDYYEVQLFLIPLEAVTDQMFTDLTGHTGTLSCTASDDRGVTVQASHPVVVMTEDDSGAVRRTR